MGFDPSKNRRMNPAALEAYARGHRGLAKRGKVCFSTPGSRHGPVSKTGADLARFIVVVRFNRRLRTSAGSKGIRYRGPSPLPGRPSVAAAS